MDAVEVTFESVDVPLPEAAELLQPGVELLKGFRFEAVETALCIHGCLHETCLAQHAQMLGDGGLRHAEPALDFTDGLLVGGQQAEDGATVGLGNDFEGRFHVSLYTS